MSAITFFDLPFEIKIHILNNLDVVTLLRLGELYPTLKEYMKEKRINEYFNLSGLYDLKREDLKATAMVATFRMESITTLNINSVYWISRNFWISFISRMSNLKCLHAIDTTLEFSDASMQAFKHLHKLETLALTFLGGYATKMCISFFQDKLTKLCLHGTFRNFDEFRAICGSLKKLKELWCMCTLRLPVVFDVTQLPQHVEKYTLNPPFQVLTANKKIITYLNISDQFSFENSRNDSHLKIYTRDAKYDDLFDQIVGTYCYPFCRKDSEEIVLKSISPSNINLSELNLKHKACYKHLVDALRNILLSDNTKLVKKLAINFCLCKQSITKRKHSKPLFKKPRIGVPNQGVSRSIFEEVVDHMTRLEELEIWECDQVDETRHLVTNKSLSSIQYIERLQKLSLLGLPVYVDGQFLIPIAQKCTKLMSLKLKSVRHLYSVLHDALKYMNNLKDLIIVQSNLNLREFFETLCKNENLKLKRICVQFDNVNLDGDDLNIVDTYLATNDQLIFFGLIFPVTNNQNKLINKIFMKYRSLPSKVYLVTRVGTPHWNSIPLVHLNQMIRFKTEISVLNIFNDFVT